MQILAVSVFGISVLEHVFKPALLIFSDGYSPFWPLHDPVGMSFCSLFRHFGQCVHGGNIFICFKAVAWWFPFLFCEKYFVIFRLSPSPCHSQRYAYGYNSILLHIQSSLFQMEELFFFFYFGLSSHLTVLGKPSTVVNPQNDISPREGALYPICEMGTPLLLYLVIARRV